MKHPLASRFIISRIFTAMSMLAASAAAHAQPVPINNPSFEDNFVADGTFPVFTPIGWTLVDPGSIINNQTNAVGCLNPTGGLCYAAGGGHAPEGRNVAIIFLQGSEASTVSLTQVLTTQLAPATRYRLRVQVGNIATCAGLPPFDVYGTFNLAGFPGYSIELRAGGTPLAQDFNTLGAPGTIPEGTFAPSTIRFTTPAAHPQFGQPLEIRLTNLHLPGTPQAPGVEVNFDALHLDRFCAADINESGAVSVQDLFDFLAAYFALNTTTADVNNSGSLSVQDIFDFLSLYFTAC